MVEGYVSRNTDFSDTRGGKEVPRRGDVRMVAVDSPVYVVFERLGLSGR